MLWATALFVGTGLLIAAIAVPLMRRRVRPNRLYGLRLPATFADEWVWYEANARSGRDLLVLGLAQAAIALLLRLFHLSEEAYVLAVVGFISFGTIAMAAVGITRANRLLRERRRSAGAGR